jgi:hypothetical protein
MLRDQLGIPAVRNESFRNPLDYVETQRLYRGADGVASLNTIDIGYGSDG